MVSRSYLVNFGCFVYLLYLFGTNLLTQCQAPVPVFSVFLTLFRSDFGTESKRNKIPKMIFFQNGRRSGGLRAKQVGPQGAHKPCCRGQGSRPRQPSLWPPWRSPALGLWPIYSLKTQKKSGVHENTFSPPQASVSVRSHLETLPGALPEGTLEFEGFYINFIASPMTHE